MTVYLHKETGELVIARKIWLEASDAIIGSTTIAGCLDALAFENEHEIVFMLPIKALEHFECLGEL